MSISSTTPKANGTVVKTPRRSSSSSDLTSVSESETKPRKKRVNDSEQAKPAKRAKIEFNGEEKGKGVYCHQ